MEEKKEYSAPSLKTFGAVADITAGADCKNRDDAIGTPDTANPSPITGECDF